MAVTRTSSRNTQFLKCSISSCRASRTTPSLPHLDAHAPPEKHFTHEYGGNKALEANAKATKATKFMKKKRIEESDVYTLDHKADGRSWFGQGGLF